MVYYIKANYRVAHYLGLQDCRVRTRDGHYILWQADMLPFGSLLQLPAIMEQIGGMLLTPAEAFTEQEGQQTRVLPTATDERFVLGGESSETYNLNNGSDEQGEHDQND